MNKFNIGDWLKVRAGVFSLHGQATGCVDIIENTHPQKQYITYRLNFGGGKNEWYKEDELEKANEPK
jgi:hypothetical protein